jgi:cobalamin biosynthetic protein CobC
LIVLCSLGKFFGLAGARVGFVCAEPSLLAQLNSLLGPWTINAAARYATTLALQDRDWQQQTRQGLHAEGTRLHALLTQHNLDPDGGCALFQWLQTPQAEQMHEQFSHQGILTRLFTEPASVRLGLPKDELGWQRLDSALAHCLKNSDTIKCRVG